MVQLSLSINLDVLFDEDTNQCTVTNQIVSVQTPSNLPLTMSHQLGVAEIRYGIFTLGSKSVIGRMIPRDTDISVIYQGTTYLGHSHKTSGGRIDRLSALLKNFHVNTCLSFKYDTAKKELYVS